jgi:hypothetical protein
VQSRCFHMDDESVLIPLDKIAQAEAIVQKAIKPGEEGQVKFLGSWWPAQSSEQITIGIGTEVKVVGRRGISLIVEPLHSQSESEFSWLLTSKSDTGSNPSKMNQLFQKGDRIIALSSGGAFLGGLIAQVPGSVVGALAGAILGYLGHSKPTNSTENP